MVAQRYPKRLIEVDLPIKRISAHARREKSIRHGHISTLHIWWARRPLAACRAVICATLWPDPADPLCPPRFRQEVFQILGDLKSKVNEGAISRDTSEAQSAISRMHFASRVEHGEELRRSLLDFIAEFANWDLSSNQLFLESCRALTQVAHEVLDGLPGTRPLVVDPFAGGGSIPLEALRIGADAFASDLNPIPVLLNKVVLEYIPKYGQRLAQEVRRWGAWIKEEADKELGEFYPHDHDGATPLAYLWARTLISTAPSRERFPVEIPLLRSMWLAKKGNRKFALRWSRDDKGAIRTIIRSIKYSDGSEKTVLRPLLEVFRPGKESDVEVGTSRGGSATCPISGFTIAVDGVRSQLAARTGGANDARVIAVVIESTAGGRTYRIADDLDEKAFSNARDALKTRSLRGELKVVPPDGQINHLRGFFNIVLYGMERWRDLFSDRQALTVITFGRLVRDLGVTLANEGEMAAAVQTCLALAVDRLTEKLTSVARWDVTRENPQGTFGRQALPMVWDFCEVNPFSGAGGDWGTAVDWVAKVLEENAVLANGICGSGHSIQASATEHPLPSESVSAVVTDPPYYAAVPYADLSDFFYSWLRQTLGVTFPDMFAEALAPKQKELVALSHRAAMYREKNSSWFESKMTEACNEARRICMPGGMGVIVFANKETAGWEAMLSALIDSAWTITASWPIDTEMGSRLRARNSAALASSVHLVCRPRENPDGSVRSNEIGDWRTILQELPRRIHEWMPRLAEEGVVGADAIFACLGPALEIFSRYSRVEKANGDVVTLKEYLEQVWATVAREALSTVLKDADSNALDPDARLTVIWLWTLGGGEGGTLDDEPEESDEEDDGPAAGTATGFTLEYDAARKIAQGLGARLEELTHVVEVKGEKARLLPVSERARYLFGKTEALPAAKKPVKKIQMSLFAEIEEAETARSWDEIGPPKGVTTTLDRLHQAMLLFGTGRGEALKRFLVEEGVGRQAAFWKLAQSLSALYPAGSDEKRWVDGVLARKKGLGFG